MLPFIVVLVAELLNFRLAESSLRHTIAGALASKVDCSTFHPADWDYADRTYIHHRALVPRLPVSVFSVLL
jgi:hypothetical protein